MSARAWTLILLLLLATRLPAIAEPPGNDQSLYTYRGERLLAGTTPYLDAWDQKPPGIAVVYAALLLAVPPPMVPAVGDIVGAGLTAWLLFVIGRRRFTAQTGYIAAAAFLLLGHPAMARVSGAYVRGQCEVFIGLAVAAMIAGLAARDHRRATYIAAGLWLGVAFWLKYNALAYALPAAVAMYAWSDRPSLRTVLRDGLLTAASLFVVVALGVGYFAATGGLDALWRATIDYNLQYSGETYRGLRGLLYPLEMPVLHAYVDFLWFLGGLGLIACLPRWRDGSVQVLVAWLVAAVVSIAVNGARDLPQYFVQAAPALALAAAAGLAALAARPRVVQIAVGVVIAVGLWRVGADEQPRLGGLRQMTANVSFDLAYLTGRIDRPAFLARFKGEQKYDASEMDAIARYISDSTRPQDPVLVFGFAPGIYVSSARVSPTRFFWSRPVVIEFAAGAPGYGSAGLLHDLQVNPPAVVVLQKRDWALSATTAGGADASGEPNSFDFFMNHAGLRAWLDAGYVPDRDTPVFAVWRRRS